ncbi:MAG: hypothetical protein AAF679_06170 [Pseudomonadota bacterium]
MKTTLITLIALTFATSLFAQSREDRAPARSHVETTERNKAVDDHSAGDEHEIEYDVSAGV